MPFSQTQPFFLVWNPKTGYTKRRHSTVQQAESEAQRLADKIPGTEFHVLLSLGRCAAENLDMEGGRK